MKFSKHPISKFLMLLLVLSLVLAACQTKGTQEPSTTESSAAPTEAVETPAPEQVATDSLQGKTRVVLGEEFAEDPKPTWTQAAIQTQTALANATPTVTPPGVVAVGRQSYQVFQGGYGLELSLSDFHVSVRGPMTWVRSRETPVNTMVLGNISKYELVSLDELRPQVFASLFGSDAKIEEEEQETFELDGIQGIAVNYVANFSQMRAKGRLVLVKPTEKRYVAVIGMGDPSDPTGDQWINHGVAFFEATLNGLSILDETALENRDTCPMAEDETYGFSKENPIKVGGEAFEGPSRARAYLDNLKGENGQWIIYERTGSMEGGSVLLDAYEVQVDGKTITLYVDQYSFETLQTPQGLKCNGAFPIVEP